MLGYRYAEMLIFLSLQKTGDAFCWQSVQAASHIAHQALQSSDFPMCLCQEALLYTEKAQCSTTTRNTRIVKQNCLLRCCSKTERISVWSLGYLSERKLVSKEGEISYHRKQDTQCIKAWIMIVHLRSCVSLLWQEHGAHVEVNRNKK